MPVKTVLKLRNGTAAQWTSTNPTLVQGELGIETDTNKFKFGDGTTAWTTLPYAVANASGTSTVDWSSVLNKPATFTPSSHTHPTSDVTGLDTALAGKASTTHTHAQADVTNLTTDLAAKAPLVSPSFTTPSLGVATATSINGTTIPLSSTLVTTAAGTATTATNIAGGAASQIPYQTGSGATAFIANGTSGQVLTSNGASAPAWATPAGGGGMTLISSVTTSAGATSASITSIPQTYKALRLIMWYGGYVPYTGYINVSFNSDTVGYTWTHSVITGTNNTSGSGTVSGVYGINTNSIKTGDISTASPVILEIPNYTNTSMYKACNMYSLYKYSTLSGMYFGAGGWANTSAITSMQFALNLGGSGSATTTIQLYGVN